MGSLLGGSLALAAAQLAAGLAWGGGWRELPEGMSWEVVQLMEMVPTLLHAAILSHWSLLIGRTLASAVLALLYELGYAASVLSLLDPTHALALQLIIITHQVRAPFLRCVSYVRYRSICDVSYRFLIMSPPVRGGGLRPTIDRA